VAGAEFVRADLHVHTFADGEENPDPDLGAYVATAVARGVSVLGITDHNTARFVRPAIAAAEGTGLFVVPGIEVSTHDGHLVALFSPDSINECEAFAADLRLTEVDGELRSMRSMLDLVDDVSRRGGIAIPAHVDVLNGIHERMGQAELVQLLSHPGLGGLEFRETVSLQGWYTDTDADPDRLAAWQARQRVDALRERGLARVMSSDAHSIQKLGVDQATRILTRLRMDDLNFEALRNAVVNNPNARCKAEVILPVTYPRIIRAVFEGGFLDGVTMEFSPNLNCIIGGRGSGKSTALLAIGAALGANPSDPTVNVDEAGRMPDRTIVHFIDSTGSVRTAVRDRGLDPTEEETGSPIRLRLADLQQEESSRLGRESEERPIALLEWLDSFVVKHRFEEAEADVVRQLEENGAEVKRTAVGQEQTRKLEEELARLQANLTAAESGQIEEIAKWATLLAAQGPLLDRLTEGLESSTKLKAQDDGLDLDELAAAYDIDLTTGRAPKFVEGEDGLREQLTGFNEKREEIRQTAEQATNKAAEGTRSALDLWKQDQADLLTRLEAKQTELEAKGLKVQAGAVREIADRLNEVKKSLALLRAKEVEHKAALGWRKELLDQLHANRDALYAHRRSTIGQIVGEANRQSDGRLVLRATFQQRGIDDVWVRWLTNVFDFRSPRVQRVAASIGPRDFASALVEDVNHLLGLADANGAFFSQETLSPLYKWETLFELELMRLEDRPHVEIREGDKGEWKTFGRLSAGQQASVLLSFLLCAERYEPLVLDQPEDHLDAQYIATGVVRHLEGAKERRQLIMATHSANLTVLGDAELVIPLRVDGGKARPHDVGAIDRRSTRNRVCEPWKVGSRHTSAAVRSTASCSDRARQRSSG
jgi:ABC-type lipoprotein export system ATPase subunit